MTKLLDLRRVARLAGQLEVDIRNRGLAPGDRYLTAKQAAELLGVSPATCNRAMQLLAERDILSRRRSSGTFVGPNLESQPVTQFRSVYILLSEDRRLGTLSQGAVLDGLWRELPGADLHFTVLPSGGEVRRIEELLSTATATGQLLGVIALSCPREVYRYLGQLSVPAVVLGSIDAGDDTLASVDGDEAQAGQLLTEYLFKRDYRQFVLLMKDFWRPGDNLFLESVQTSLSHAGLPMSALRVRSLADDRRLFVQQLRSILSDVTEPLGIICQDARFVQWLDGLRQTDPDLNWQRVGIVFNTDVELPQNSAGQYPCAYLQVPVVEMAATAGKMVAQLNSGEELEQRHVLLPMALYEPEESRQ